MYLAATGRTACSEDSPRRITFISPDGEVARKERFFNSSDSQYFHHFSWFQCVSARWEFARTRYVREFAKKRQFQQWISRNFRDCFR